MTEEPKLIRHSSGLMLPEGTTDLPCNAPRTVDPDTKLDGDFTPPPETQAAPAQPPPPPPPKEAPPAAAPAPEES